MAGSHPREYEHGISQETRLGENRVAYLRCVAGKPSGFGTLMQMIGADEYRGNRVRFSGSVRAADVDGWAGLWMRVDGPVHGSSLAFDNMQQRPIKGGTDWQRYQVVLDVAPEARAIAFGILLSGSGEVDVADFGFETVAADVPTTDKQLPAQPQNLDLAED